uniref:hypothetical protein n=1 Tax=uncultured Ruminococcus sp. TaxID=165186 RepID=UPI0025DFE1D0|nr:hypothetical protein [uncultured Ruminococcus sp.]
MAYTKTNWEDAPSTATPLCAENLNKIENGIYENSIDIALAGDNINTLSERTIAINTALSAKADKTELEDEITDLDETVTMKINLKADKDSVDNAVAQLSKQIADNKSSADESISTLSQTVTDNKTATDKSLAAKYNSSNVENGTGELSPGQTIYEGCAGKFDYVKNGKVVTVSVNITKLVANKSYIQMSGLPFPAKNESRLSNIAVYSSTNKLRSINLAGSWLFISSPTDKFTDDEKINFTITYIRQ